MNRSESIEVGCGRLSGRSAGFQFHEITSMTLPTPNDAYSQTYSKQFSNELMTSLCDTPICTPTSLSRLWRHEIV